MHESAWHEAAVEGGAEHLLCPGTSDVNLFCYCQCVIYFDAQVRGSAERSGSLFSYVDLEDRIGRECPLLIDNNEYCDEEGCRSVRS